MIGREIEKEIIWVRKGDRLEIARLLERVREETENQQKIEKDRRIQEKRKGER